MCVFETAFMELDGFDFSLLVPSCWILEERISEAERICSSVEIQKTEFARM